MKLDVFKRRISSTAPARTGKTDDPPLMGGVTEKGMVKGDSVGAGPARTMSARSTKKDPFLVSFDVSRRGVGGSMWLPF